MGISNRSIKRRCYARIIETSTAKSLAMIALHNHQSIGLLPFCFIFPANTTPSLTVWFSSVQTGLGKIYFIGLIYGFIKNLTHRCHL